MLIKAKHRLAGLLTIVVVVASSLVAASPARAYGSVWVYVGIVDLTDCSELSVYDFDFFSYQGGCRHNDSIDYTFFRPNTGGEGMKFMLYAGGPRGGGGEVVAKVEFHPYDELLWIYDTKNDSDTIYVRLRWWRPDGSFGFTSPHAPPGTSNPIDTRVVDLSYPEGTEIRMEVYDDAQTSPSELLASFGRGIA